VTDAADRRRDEETIVAVKPGFGAADRPVARDIRTGPSLPLVGAVAVLLLGLAIAVFFMLPRWVEQRVASVPAPPPAEPPAAATPAAPELSAEQLAALQGAAESLLADLLQQRGRVESRSAANWAAEDWARYQELSRAGDDALLADEFQTAADHYSAALAAGESLLARAERLVAAALASADQATQAGYARLAIEQYDLVLGIEPANDTAMRGRARAERLPAVLDLAQRAQQARQDGELTAAAELYREALAIDAEWPAARTGLAAVTAALAAERFEGFLSRGFAALADEEYADAEQHFLAALELQPGSESARDGLTQAEEGRKLDVIALSEARALAFERRELWAQAVERYEAALAEDPTVAFAIAGRERSRARADLDTKLENLIANPNLLLTDGVLDDARGLVEQARPLAEAGTRIAAQVERLDTLIRVASTPIAVQLTSDGQTEVTVYRVGPLGAFATTEIEVRPGTYTAVGSRQGYRDVRATFTVVPGRETPAVRIVCSEQIG
jgi:tetratricopeptide (TPR) repeat protein